jgi:hypothetical protein
MTGINIQNQIKQLLAQHMAQMQNLMSDAQAKQTEAIFAGFTAGREEQRKSTLEGEISQWKSEMAVGQTAENYVNYAQANAGLAIHHKIDAKLKKLESEKNSMLGYLSYLKDQMASLKEQYAQSKNPLLVLFMAIFELVSKVVEAMIEKKDREQEALAEKMSSQDIKMSGILKNSELTAQSNKELATQLLSQANQSQNKAGQLSHQINGQSSSIEKQNEKDKLNREFKMNIINDLMQKVQQSGKELPIETLMSLQQLNGTSSSKIVVDKSLTDVVFDDLAKLVGEENVIINRRNDDRRGNDDRRNTPPLPVNEDTRADTAGRRKGDRRANDSIFLG